MIDRLVHHAEVITLKGDRYRLKDRDLHAHLRRDRRRVNGLRSYLRWPVFTSPRLAAFARPLTLGTQAVGDERANRASQSRTASWVNSKPRSRNIFGEVAQAQLVAEAPADEEEDHVGGELEEGEGGAGALVEGVLAG